MVAYLLDVHGDLLLEVAPQLEELLLLGHAHERGRIARILLLDVEHGAKHVLIFLRAVGKAARELTERRQLRIRAARCHALRRLTIAHTARAVAVVVVVVAAAAV